MKLKSLLILVIGVFMLLSCSKGKEQDQHKPEDHKHEEHHEHSHHDGHNHTAHHGGVLNVVHNCETGHAEVKIIDDTFKLWFVGGGNHTNKAVRIIDKEIELLLHLEDKTEKKLVLKANPIELAEETVGDCSHFTAKADWLKEIDLFIAEGEVNFKGKEMKLHIEYPHGFDPDHENCEHDDHEHHHHHGEEHHHKDQERKHDEKKDEKHEHHHEDGHHHKH